MYMGDVCVHVCTDVYVLSFFQENWTHMKSLWRAFVQMHWAICFSHVYMLKSYPLCDDGVRRQGLSGMLRSWVEHPGLG